MAKNYKVNFQPATGAEAMFELKNVLTGSGWTVVSSSNGVTLSSGDAMTSTSLAASNAWFLVQEPSGIGGRQWCFQRTTANTTWRVKISPGAQFSGGSPSATRVPSATDEGVINGSGTDASPTGAQLFPTDNSYKFHIISDDTAIGPAGNQVYGFWAFTNIVGGIADVDMETIIFQEPLAVGTYPALVGTRASTTSGDADPVLYACSWESGGLKFALQGGNTAAYLAGVTTETNNTVRYFYDYQSLSGSFTAGDEAGGFYQNVWGYGQNPTSAQDVLLPLVYGRPGAGVTNFWLAARSTFVGFKGVTNFLRKSTVARSNSDTVNLSTNAYVYVGDLLIPWPENITPVF